MQDEGTEVAVAFEDKVSSLREVMKKEKLSALFFYCSGQLSMLEVNAVLWISGALPMGPHTGVLVTEKGEAVHLISLSWDEGRVRRQSWIKDVRHSESFVGKVGQYLCEKGIQGEVGIVGWAFMPAVVFNELAMLSGAHFRPADGILESLARSPGADALPALKRAGEIADAGFLALLDKARVGMVEYELSAEVEYAMRWLGSEDNFGMVTASDHNHCTHPPSDRKLRPGDIIIAEITPAYGGHFVQLCRTAVMEPVPSIVREKFPIMEEAMEKSLAVVRPGNKAGDISRAMNEVFAAYGYAEYCRPPYIRVRGHGLGFMSLPFAEMIDENESVIEEGTDFVVHPNQYLPETGYLMLGDTIWVEKNGYRRLTQTPMKLFTISG
ncbi:MAG: M24 family metallopeptidase [Candidatus Binatia bacterium]